MGNPIVIYSGSNDYHSVKPDMHYSYGTYRDDMIKAIVADSISSYPTEPGIYRVTHSVAGLPSGASFYGGLRITDYGSYTIHEYFPTSGNTVYVGYQAQGGSSMSPVITAPTKWYKFTTSTSVDPVT